MRRRNQSCLLAVVLVAVFAFSGSALQAACNWEFNALADVWELGLTDQIKSYHFTDIENVDCINSRKIALKATVLHDNALVHNKNYVGGDAVQGQFLIENLSFACSLDSWRASSTGGTRFLGLYLWYASSNSPIFFAGCDCPDGGGGSSPTEVAVLGGGTRAVKVAGLRTSPLARDRLSYLDGVTYAIDEWAVLENQRILRSSSREFASVAEDRARAVGLSSDAQVLVEAPIHPDNERWIARPRVALEERSTSRDLPRSLQAFSRIEFSPTGELLGAKLLHASRDLRPVETAFLVAELRERVDLEYVGLRRHRAAAFVEVETDSAGALRMVHGIVVVHRCRCGPE